MSGYANSILGGASKLIRAAIQSPNYVPATSGWTINKDGSAEFNNLTVRGTFFGVTYILNSLGAFFYSGTPALGNLVVSIAASAGTDGFGNVYKADVGVYGTDGTFLEMLAGAPASLFIGSGDSAETTAARLLTQVSGAGVTRKIATTARAPRVSGENANAACSMVLISPSADLSQGVNVSLVASDDGVNFSTINLTQAAVAISNGTTVSLNSGTGQFNVTPTGASVVNVAFTSTAGTLANPTVITTDTIHTTTLSNGWANQGGGLEVLHHWLKNDNVARLQGVVTSAASTSTTITTLPAGYRPQIGQDFGVGFHTATGPTQGVFCRVATTGVVSILNSTTTTGVVIIDCHIELEPTT